MPLSAIRELRSSGSDTFTVSHSEFVIIRCEICREDIFLDDCELHDSIKKAVHAVASSVKTKPVENGKTHAIRRVCSVVTLLRRWSSGKPPVVENGKKAVENGKTETKLV